MTCYVPRLAIHGGSAAEQVHASGNEMVVWPRSGSESLEPSQQSDAMPASVRESHLITLTSGSIGTFPIDWGVIRMNCLPTERLAAII